MYLYDTHKIDAFWRARNQQNADRNAEQNKDFVAPSLTSVYNDNMATLKEQEAKHQEEVSKSPYALQVPIDRLPPTSPLAIAEKMRMINPEVK